MCVLRGWEQLGQGLRGCPADSMVPCPCVCVLVCLCVCMSACPCVRLLTWGKEGGIPASFLPHDAMEHLTRESSLSRLTPESAFPRGENPAALPKPAQTLWAPAARLLQDFWQNAAEHSELEVGSALLWMSLSMGPGPKVGWPYLLPARLHSTSSLGLLPACG